jgi:glucose/arabinose dehydrogenase
MPHPSSPDQGIRTMNRSQSLALLLTLLPVSVALAQKPLPKPMVTGLVNPESVCLGPGPGRRLPPPSQAGALGLNFNHLYVTTIGDFDKDGDGAVMLIEDGKAKPFVTGLDDPKGMGAYQRWLFVADKTKVYRIDATLAEPKVEIFAPANAFPVPPLFLNDIAVDPESGTVFVSDSGREGSGGAVYRISPNGLVSTVVDAKRLPGINTPNGLAMDGASHLIMADFGSGFLYRIKLADNSYEKIAEGFDGADGVTWDNYGRLYVSSWKLGKLWVIPRPGDKPKLVAEGFQSAADTCLDTTGRFILVPDMKAGTITAIPAQVPGEEIDDSPLPIKTEIAFPDLKWSGWSRETPSGLPSPLRPLVLTHAGDGSNRIFVATQHGVIHMFPNDQKATETKVFLDIQDRVKYNDNTNEEGFLGMAFHPKFKETGEVFVYYTPKKEKMANIVSRFRLSKDDPTKLDPNSEEQLVRYTNRPFWNHDGGTVCFGPDGYLYIVHGDGGAGNDLFDNGQNLGTWFGKILRIDVDHKDEGKNYAVPKDNPFVGTKGALPEIWAYGLRNPWRMSFDRKTGQLWCADVGQNLFEEIDLIVKGGNYGWNRREGLHPFGAKGTGPKKDLIEPIWEYSHDVGKSMTGGTVYRGKQFPEMEGYYLHADYVTSRIWALKYDEKLARVVANRSIKDPAKPVMSFGEDEEGEVYFMTFAPNGKGIYKFTK